MRVLTGVQPTGRIHLGNYFGVIRPCLELQHRHDSAYLLANLHALTAVNDASRLREWTLDTALDLLALGLDPRRAALYLQSDIPEVPQLAWLLGVVAPVDLLQNACAFRGKTRDEGFAATCGLLSYPVLMAADILAAEAECVVVGADQAQNVEICRTLATEFNRRFGEVFVIPELRVLTEVANVPGTDGASKMSKHTENAIEVFESLTSLSRRLANLPDPVRGMAMQDTPLYRLYTLFVSRRRSEWLERRPSIHAVVDVHRLKGALISEFEACFAEARVRRRHLAREPEYVERVLASGARAIRARANDVLSRAHHAMGVRRGGLFERHNEGALGTRRLSTVKGAECTAVWKRQRRTTFHF